MKILKRLTERDTHGRTVFTEHANRCDSPLYAVLERLATYEDTELTPEEIENLKCVNANRKKLLAEAAKAIDYLDKELNKHIKHEEDMLRLDAAMKSMTLEIDESETFEIDERGDIYEATRSAWHINPKNAKKHPYVLSSLYGVVKAVYEVDEWKKCDEREGRWEFDGHPAPKEISDIFVGRRIPDYYKSKGNQNPIAYKKTK